MVDDTVVVRRRWRTASPCCKTMHCCCVRFVLASEAGGRPILRHLRDKDDNEVSGIEKRNTQKYKKKNTRLNTYFFMLNKLNSHSRQLLQSYYGLSS